jgi:glycosyltransferase involved in cell wall biosynthesis
MEAIHSSLTQSVPPVEMVVLDDSPEGSAETLVESLKDARVRYVRRAEPSEGCPAVVRNDGWPRVTGEYVHFLDDDDVLLPGAYRALVNALQAHPRAAVAFGRVEPFGAGPEVMKNEARFFRSAGRRARIGQGLHSRFWMLANMLFKNTVVINSAGLIRRSCLEALGGYDPQLRLFEDLELFIRAFREFGCVFVDRTVLKYRVGAPSLMTNLRDNQPILDAYRTIHEKYQKAYGAYEYFALKLFARTVLRVV